MLSVLSVKVGTQKGTIINTNNEKVDKMVDERIAMHFLMRCEGKCIFI
jgi:hypothetical protein